MQFNSILLKFQNTSTYSLINILPFYSVKISVKILVHIPGICQNMFLIKHALIHMDRACYILVLTTYLTSTNFSFFESEITKNIQNIYCKFEMLRFKESFLQFLGNSCRSVAFRS